MTVPSHVKAAFTTIERYQQDLALRLALLRDEQLTEQELTAQLDVMIEHGR